MHSLSNTNLCFLLMYVISNYVQYTMEIIGRLRTLMQLGLQGSLMMRMASYLILHDIHHTILHLIGQGAISPACTPLTPATRQIPLPWPLEYISRVPLRMEEMLGTFLDHNTYQPFPFARIQPVYYTVGVYDGYESDNDQVQVKPKPKRRCRRYHSSMRKYVIG